MKAWLTQGEQILINNRLTIAAQVAVLRGVLISADRGVIPSGMAFRTRTTARTVKDAAAADMLRKAEELISAAISADAGRFAEGDRLIRQIVAVAHRKGLTSAVPRTNQDFEAWKVRWEAVSMDPDLKAAAAHLVGLVGAHDVLILLDRAWPTT